ncbi:MAG: hypothetical protein HY241_14590 [Actinobacteria bacterium]|nr:hypothetical protein [Actinomycetota bacterium]
MHETVTQDGPRYRNARRVARMVGGVAFALTPWVTFGFATPVAFVLAAVVVGYRSKTHAVVLWVSAAFYAAVLVVEFATVDTAPGAIFITCLIITMVGGGLQSFALAVTAATKGYRRRTQPSPPPHQHPITDAAETVRAIDKLPNRSFRKSRQRPATAAAAPTRWDAASIGWFLFLMLGIPIFLGVRGAQEMGVSADLDRRGVPTMATVVTVEHESFSPPYGALIEWTDVTVVFTDAHNASVRTTRRGRDTTKVGDKLDIVYDPQHPTHARWNTAVDEAPLDFISAGAFLVVLLVWLVDALRARRRRRNPDASPLLEQRPPATRPATGGL